MNPILLTAGLMGACLVFGIAWLIPQIGAGRLMIALLAGQIVGGLVLSHYGWLGSPQEPVTLTRALGALVVLGGAAMVTFSK
jgi:transporter family-2 protein